MIKRILVGLGGEPYAASEVQHAIDLARAHDAEVTAVTVMDLQRLADVGPLPIGASSAAADLVDYRMHATETAIAASIELFTTSCRTANVRCHVITETGDPLDELICLWRYHDITVLSLQRLFEYGVVRDPKDMLVQLIAGGVRPIIAVARQPRAVRRILIAYNGSTESAKAMKQFVQMRLWPVAEVHIATFEFSGDTAKPLLRDAVDYLRSHGVSATSHIDPGHPNDRMLPFAAEIGADMLVMGATARARIFRHLVGDTALHLLKHSQLPLFVTQ